MVQIDPLLAYGLASTLAVVAERPGLAPAHGDRRLTWTVLWLGLTFAPQAVFLLWRFPAWETMFVFTDPAQIPAWIAAGTPVAILGLGALGYVVTRWLRREGRGRVALALTAAAFVASVVIVTIGWDGTGWQRMLYAGDGSDWSAGVAFSPLDFLGTDLLLTLVWLETVLLVPFAWMLFRWRRAATVEVTP